jgi:hypothetical protein
MQNNPYLNTEGKPFSFEEPNVNAGGSGKEAPNTGQGPDESNINQNTNLANSPTKKVSRFQVSVVKEGKTKDTLLSSCNF